MSTGRARSGRCGCGTSSKMGDREQREDSRNRERGGDREGGDREQRDAGEARAPAASGGSEGGNGGGSTSLLCRNISYTIRAEELKQLFGRYGEVRDVYIPQDYYQRKPKGFAFIEFYERRDAIAAVEGLDRHEMDGRELNVVFAKDRRKTPDEMRRVDQRVDQRPGRESRDRGDRDRGDRDRGDRGRGRDRSRSRSRDRRGGDYDRRDYGRDTRDGRDGRGGRDGGRDYRDSGRDNRDYGRERDARDTRDTRDTRDRNERRRSPSPDRRRRSPSPAPQQRRERTAASRSPSAH